MIPRILLKLLKARKDTRNKIKHKKVKRAGGKAVYFKTTLALIGVVSGAFAFIGALILKDALQSSINGITAKFKVWWLRTLIYTVL